MEVDLRRPRCLPPSRAHAPTAAAPARACPPPTHALAGRGRSPAGRGRTPQQDGGRPPPPPPRPRAPPACRQPNSADLDFRAEHGGRPGGERRGAGRGGSFLLASTCGRGREAEGGRGRRRAGAELGAHAEGQRKRGERGRRGRRGASVGKKSKKKF
ncbi:hypothetical protein PVAP13_2NG567020 [Panicum virgatum]|uniref:Uncharacterized protein n=1 Tax=Panicum virgatum TaxID=38727 RepID=A0A8T0VSS2_PANVG|nr:hypothetical protein PVAP13_2NG567020 [Panicum virgatum]